MDHDLRIDVDKSFSEMSDYNWVNIELGGDRIGKARVSISGSRLIINSINIFPEFERNGYARRVIAFCKDNYEEIVADRVRDSARVFWGKMNFNEQHNGNYVWRK
jgi:hypothetical protein